MMTRKIKRYGWNPDHPDQRDLLYIPPGLASVPPRVDLTDKCPSVYDQGQLGSCTGNAIAAALQFEQMRQGVTAFLPSRIFIYYNERAMEGTTKTDSGAAIRDGIKSVNKLGVCSETAWPYVLNQFAVKPGAGCYRAALKNQVTEYRRIAADLLSMQACLAGGSPFVFGFSVYESFETAAVARTGRVPMPTAKEKLLGGHAVLCVGYDAPSKTFIVRNSWGTGWGLHGYCLMPFDYLIDPKLSDDRWTITAVETGK